ncbi:hypothetical protein [Acidithrix ferrooxidans]|uniref:hypothetical protein n=1 Tax=Acidithrix ferrooxidans TaxID=1280514 RepID=UPI000696D5A5|nr:hypothetical protein [Acidithrix ferrooxidans]
MKTSLRKAALLGSSLTMIGAASLATVFSSTNTASADPASNTKYTPIAFNLSNLITSQVVSSSTHFEQTLKTSDGNYWVSTTSGYLIEFSGTSDSAIGYIHTADQLYDGVVVPVAGSSDRLYFINQRSSNCTVVELSLSGLTFTSAGSLQYTTPKLNCVVNSSTGKALSGQSSYSIATDGTNVYLTQPSLVLNPATTSTYYNVLWEIKNANSTTTTSLAATAFILDPTETIGSAMGIYGKYAYIGGASHHIYSYLLSTLSPANNAASNPNTPNVVYSVPSNGGGFGDFQGVTTNGSSSELWFVREFNKQVGYIPIATTGSITGYDYQIGGSPNNEIESMTYDPHSGNLWIASGNVNGVQYSNVSFGYFNINALSSSVTGTSSVKTLTPTWYKTPTGVSEGADDFALYANGNPIYYFGGPTLSIKKTDSVGGIASISSFTTTGGSTTIDSNFNFTVTVGLPTQIGNIQNRSESKTITVTDPVPSQFSLDTVSGPSGATPNWNCQVNHPQNSFSCSYTPASPIAPGTTLPPITVGVKANATGSFTNTATAESEDANPVQWSDTVTVSSPATTTTTTAPPTTTPVTVPSFSSSTTTPPPTTTPVTAPSLSTTTTTAPPTTTPVTAPSLSTTTTTAPPTTTPVTAPSLSTTTTTPPTTLVPVTAPSFSSSTTTPPTTLVPVTAPSTANPATTVPKSASQVVVPSTHTGKPWGTLVYWYLAALLAIVGSVILWPRGKQYKSNS